MTQKQIARSERGGFFASFMGALDVSAKTKSGYERAFKQFAQWAESEGLELSQMKRADICSYRDHMMQSHKASTVRAYLVPVRAFYKWTASEGIYPNITEGVKSPKQPRGFAKDCLTPDQALSVLDALETRNDPNALRDLAIVNLVMRTGLRSIEVARADIGDLRTMGARRVLWIQGKGRDSKDDFVIVPEEAAKPIDDYLSSRGGASEHEPLFASSGNRNKDGRMTTRSISRICKESFKSVGIDSERVTAHSLRHTAITAALIGGATVQEAQAMARHSDITTTMIYSHNIDRAANPAEVKASAYFERRERI